MNWFRYLILLLTLEVQMIFIPPSFLHTCYYSGTRLMNAYTSCQYEGDEEHPILDKLPVCNKANTCDKQDTDVFQTT